MQLLQQLRSFNTSVSLVLFLLPTHMGCYHISHAVIISLFHITTGLCRIRILSHFTTIDLLNSERCINNHRCKDLLLYDSFWEIVTFYFQRNLCTLSVTSHLNQFVFTQIWSALVYYVAGELNDVEARRPTYVASAGPLLLLLQPDLRD